VRERVAVLAAALALATRSGVADAATRPGVHVLGTVVSSDASRSLAVVDEGGAHRVVHVGDPLAGATVVEIKSDALILRRAGRAETLDLQSVSRALEASAPVPASPAPADLEERPAAGPEAGARPAPRPARASPPSSAARSRTASAPASAAHGSSGPSPAPKTPDEVMAQLALQAQFVAVNDNSGKLRGVAVLNIVPDSMLERLGLQSSDVVTSIKGVAVDSSGAALATARGLDLSQPFTLGVERHGVPTTVVVNLQGR